MEALDESRIRSLLEQSERASAAGDGAAALRLLLEARKLSPEHPLVLNEAGAFALRQGHAEEARYLFERALAVRKSAAFYVNLAAAQRGSETREWRLGEAWVFDDTIEHEAWNDSDHPRAILIFDVWNPFIDEGARALIRRTIPTIADFYGAGSFGDTGGI